MQLLALIDDYCIWHEVSGHSPKTIEWYRWTLTTFAHWLAANERTTTLATITVNDARAFLQAEAQRRVIAPNNYNTRSGTLSDRTLHGYARAIRAFFNWLVREEYLDKSPMTKLTLPKLEKRYTEVLSTTEIERLLAELNPKTFLGARMYAMIALLYDSGLRIGEVVNLDLGDIQWNDYQLRVLGKGKKERLVPFGPATHRALRKFLTVREPLAHGSEVLFISVEGQRLTRNSVTLAIKRLGQRAGIPRLHPHLLRHSAAVAYIMNGGDQFGLKRILGHADLSTTDGYMDYAQQHLAEQHKRFSPMARVNERRGATPNSRKKRRRT